MEPGIGVREKPVIRSMMEHRMEYDEKDKRIDFKTFTR
jgi:hypothetical protein